MSTSYHVYANDGLGGVVDYTTPITTTASLTYSPAALAASSDTTFAVRAFDTVSGFEESNVDAITRIVLDAAYVDITGRPNAPYNVSARPTASGGCRVEWDYATGGQGGRPTGFKIWLTAGVSVNYAGAVTNTTTYSGRPRYSADLTGLSDGTDYIIGIRSYNATATEPNTTATATVTGDATAPDAIDSLTASATYRD